MATDEISPREMVERLVAFDTTSAKSNLALINDVADYLGGHGIDARIITSGDGTKANLLASIGPEAPGGVVLSGHTDVVPVTGQAWESEPFEAVERDGKLYGRGTADMKSFIACALAAVPRFRDAELKRPVHLALSYDEEVGCLGVGDLIAALKVELPEPAAVIVGEPTEMKVVGAHKGVFAFHTTLEGREAHSSLPHLGANTILAAGELIAEIAAMAEEQKASASPDCPFDPPHTTFNVGVIEGGEALNIVPRRCRFEWEFRPVPGDEAEAFIAHFEKASERVLARLRETAEDARITTEASAEVPPLAPEADGAAEALARRLTGQNTTDVVSYGTEGGLFQRADLSTVVCGPGNIAQAHKPNEFIALSQIDACEAFLEKLARWLSE